MLYQAFPAAFGLLSATLAQAITSTNATITYNNIPGAVYKAQFNDDSNGNTAIVGFVAAMSSVDGIGLIWEISLGDFVVAQGPYTYHVHEFAVPNDGNCTATGAHLDPKNRTETPPCDSTHRMTCQVGDLTGKWGKIATVSLHTIYHDLYTSTLSTQPAFVGNRSIVIHNAAGARVACANLVQIAGDCGSTPPASITASPTGAAASESDAGSNPTVVPVTTITATAVATGGAPGTRGLSGGGEAGLLALMMAWGAVGMTALLS